MPVQCTERFDWLIYRDATLAGFATLLPLPYVDDMVENRFRSAMPTAIAQRRDVSLDPEIVDQINRQRSALSARLQRLLLWPLRLPAYLMKRLLRKFLYLFSVQSAVAALSHYWRRAFLIDYMVCEGYLERDSAPIAVEAMHAQLKEEQTDPLSDLAMSAIRSVPRIPRHLVQLVRGSANTDESGALDGLQEFMQENWPSFSRYFDGLAAQYEERYQTLRAAEGADERLTAGVHMGAAEAAD